MHVFSHSSKTDGGNDGLEFLSTRDARNEVLEDGTISYSEGNITIRKITLVS